MSKDCRSTDNVIQHNFLVIYPKRSFLSLNSDNGAEFFQIKTISELRLWCMPCKAMY